MGVWRSRDSYLTKGTPHLQHKKIDMVKIPRKSSTQFRQFFSTSFEISWEYQLDTPNSYGGRYYQQKREEYIVDYLIPKWMKEHPVSWFGNKHIEGFQILAPKTFAEIFEMLPKYAAPPMPSQAEKSTRSTYFWMQVLKVFEKYYDNFEYANLHNKEYEMNAYAYCVVDMDYVKEMPVSSFEFIEVPYVYDTYHDQHIASRDKHSILNAPGVVTPNVETNSNFRTILTENFNDVPTLLQKLEYELKWFNYIDSPYCIRPLLITNDHRRFEGRRCIKMEKVHPVRIHIFTWEFDQPTIML